MAGGPRLRAAAGFVVLAYVLWLTVGIGAVALHPATYDRMQRIQASGPLRLVGVLVVFAMLFHLCDGIATLAARRVTALDEHVAGVSAAIWFVTLAAGIPLGVAVLWPLLGGTGR